MVGDCGLDVSEGGLGRLECLGKSDGCLQAYDTLASVLPAKERAERLAGAAVAEQVR